MRPLTSSLRMQTRCLNAACCGPAWAMLRCVQEHHAHRTDGITPRPEMMLRSQRRALSSHVADLRLRKSKRTTWLVNTQ